MVIDRLGTILFAAGIAGIAWMAASSHSRGSRRSVARQDRAAASEATLEEPPITTTFGEPMRGPFDSLEAVCNGCALDVKTMTGIAPFEEVTVIVLGHAHEPPDLGDFAATELAVRIHSKWYFKTLGEEGVACGGMGSPIWSDVKADAPRFVQPSHSHGIEVSVRTVEHHSSGNTKRTFEEQVVCGLDDNGVPACVTEQLAGYETTGPKT